MGTKGKVLVVDDVQKWQTLIRDILATRGYETDVASSYSEALNKIRSATFDVATLHFLETPSDGLKRRTSLLDALELFQEFRQRRIPVVLISGYLTDELVAKSAGLGIVAYLEKNTAKFPTELERTIESSVAGSETRIKRVQGDKNSELSSEQKRKLKELTRRLFSGEIVRFN